VQAAIRRGDGVTDTTTHYETLRMPPASSREDLHRAYLDLAEAAHSRGNFEPGFAEVTTAWAILKDSKARRLYDRQLKLEGILDCARCEGRGLRAYQVSWSISEERVCRECNGTGRRRR
jgi:DnaJ-class molecular chaperone